jgi:hypothetical protein
MEEMSMDVFQKPATIDMEIVKNLGPLAALAGIWEGDQGLDTAPAKNGQSETKFRERMTFEPLGPMVNGRQVLYGLRYATVAWPLREEHPFHEEVGYWLWDPNEQLVLRCFIVPRGVMVNAGGKADPQGKGFELSAEVGSETFGILSSPFLDQAFKTVRYKLKVMFQGDGQFSYFEDTQLKIYGRDGVFHHTDQNALTRL